MRIKRILNLDGGGMKGLFSSYFMDSFCKQAGIDPNKIYQYFDFIGGTSIGAIMGAAYAYGIPPSTLIDFFINTGPQIFTGLTGLTGSGPLSAASKTAALGGLINVPRDNGSFYGSGGWLSRDKPNTVLTAALKGIFGDTKMFQLKTNALFAVVERISTNATEELAFNYRPALISNLLGIGLEGQNYNVSDVVQASGSAPFYFPPYPIVDSNGKTRLYIDGGIGINNPSAFLLGYSDLIGDDYDRIVMLSVGCGLGNTGFYDPTVSDKSKLMLSVADNIEYLQQMIGVAGGSAQEAAAAQMQLLSDLNIRINGADFIHYRFNYVYDKNQNTELDNQGAIFNAYMKTASDTQLKNDEWKIAAFINSCDF